MRIEEKNSKNQNGLLMITIGLLLIAAALFITAFNLYEELRAEKASSQAVNYIEEYLVTEPPAEIPTTATEEPDPLLRDERTVIPDYVLAPNMEMPVETINGIDFIGVLRIPALELELPIISEWNYHNLKSAPCRYSGSAYLNNLIICGHNYTSHFGNLKNLKEGDLATFTDMDGNVFTYRMVERETLLPTSIEAMESGDWDLTLFTCTVGGQSRVTIRFELEED
jgi:sortase A